MGMIKELGPTQAGPLGPCGELSHERESIKHCLRRIEDISYSETESKFIARTESGLSFEVDSLAQEGDYIDVFTEHVLRIVGRTIRPSVKFRPGKRLFGE